MTARSPRGATIQSTAVLLSAVDREAHDWLLRFVSGTATGGDLEAFRSWAARSSAHIEAFDNVCRIWEGTGPANQLLLAARGPARQGSMGRRGFISGAIAATVAGYLSVRPPLGLWPSVSELAADYRTAPGERRSIALSGGPSVELNTRTSISLLPSEGGAEGFRLIAGEASISARVSGRAVRVKAGAGEIRSNSAIFNVRYDGEIVRTTCIEGKVMVACGGRSALIGASDQITYSANGLGAGASVDAAAVTSWRSGILTFEEAPLTDAIAEINRYRTGPIILANAELGRRLFNAQFPISSIDGVVEQIKLVFGAHAVELPGGIILLS
ncbi:FecR domain-containing protein [Hyphomicrobium sp. NDB2Meth4]|uniref:FecR family protein n=1 Tax=Hyphomicrobium sp. NDB2Meth4 TaxID=1892846 RepID=UPI000931B9FA|nr:FecR domain-containing protein [Hyphomicrobium sp. NDB2Meth4]